MLEVTNTRKISYILKLSLINLIGLAFALYCLNPLLFHKTNTVALSRAQQKPFQPPALLFPEVVSGLPVRLIIPGSAIDIPVDRGYYQASTDSWTLSGYRAQFAMTSTLPNNIEGNTFIYGHNNDFVFGSLRHYTPKIGAEALVFTTNDHEFEYDFVKSFSLAPYETNVINSNGPPMLTIQTCTGSLNQWRTMYQFNFIKVVSLDA